MMTASNITTKLKCPYFAADVVCVEGHRYRIVSQPAPSPHPLDLDGLLYLGECLQCPKATHLEGQQGEKERDKAKDLSNMVYRLVAEKALASAGWQPYEESNDD